MKLKEKLTSTQFWLSVALFLYAIAVTVKGVSDANQTLEIIGAVCGIFAVCIFVIVRGSVDAVEADQSEETNEPESNEEEE